MTESPLDCWARGNTETGTLSDFVLFTRLAETIDWCTLSMASATCEASMRSKLIEPPVFHAGYDDVVCDVGSSRRFRLPDENRGLTTSMPHLRGGRLFCLFPEGNLVDGAAEPESDGFFDVFNIPPWDTWVGYFTDCDRPDDCERSYLLCYAPKELIELADAGMVVNPEECIRWIDKTDVSLRSRLGVSQTGG